MAAMQEALAGLKVAIVTPTFGRSAFLRQTLAYVLQQQVHGATLKWFVLDDSPAPERRLPAAGPEPVSYRWVAGRMPLGAKRNALNDMALHWGADFICSMDDDDWYGDDYVAEMVQLLRQGPHEFAGSGEHYYYDVPLGAVLRAFAVRDLTSCNGVLCYRASVLRRGARYGEDARSGEEPAFIGHSPVTQHADIRRVNLALSHLDNTVSKKNYRLNPKNHTALTLADFPMRPADRLFHENLHAAHALRHGEAMRAMLHQAMARQRAGDLAAARRLYEAMLSALPDHFDALHLLGVVLLQSGERERGCDLIRQALALNPQVAAAHANLGNGLRELGQLEAALASYAQAVALHADYAEAHLHRGHVLRQLGRPAEATASYARALALNPGLAASLPAGAAG